VAPPPPSQPSIKVLKQFAYRGQTKRWSNRYFMTGGSPSNSTQWTTLSDAVVTAEKATLGSIVTIVETFGYEAGSDVPVFSKTYSTAGTLSTGAGLPAPGDAAALVRYSTAARTSRNHPIYLFNYVHNAYVSSTTGGDALLAGQVTALGTYAAAWLAGFSDGSHTLKRTGPYGHDATGYLVSPYVTHRDFPRG